MKTLLVFEHRKFWRSRKNWMALALLVFALLGMIWYNNSLDKAYWGNMREMLQSDKNRAYSVQTEVDAEREAARRNDPDDTATIQELTRKRDFMRTQYLFVVQQLNTTRNYLNGEASALDVVALVVERDLHLLRVFEAGYDYLDETPAQVNQRLAVNQYLLEHNIQPLNSPYQMVGTNFITKLTEYPWILVLILPLALFTIDLFSGEFEGGAYKVLYSQPFTRAKIHGVKFGVYFANSFLLVTAQMLLAFLLVSLVNGLGDVSYPVNYFSGSYQGLGTVMLEGAEGITFMPWLQLIGKTIPLFVLLCGFTVALMGAGSFFLTTTANVLNGLFCLMILDFVARTLFPAESAFYTFWPFTAAGINSVLQGFHRLSAAGYVLLLGVLTIALLTASLVALKRRQLTGGIGL